MEDYVAKWNQKNVQLVAMGTPLIEKLLVTILVESFDDRSDSLFRIGIFAPWKRLDLILQTLAS